MARAVNLEKRERWKEILLKHNSSGISGRQYCSENNLDFNQFSYFKKVFSRLKSKRSPFIKVVPKLLATPAPGSSSKITLLHGELSLSFEGDFDNAKISSLYLSLRGHL